MAQEQYIKQATKQYDVGYNAKVQAYKNTLAETLASQEGQKLGINANYNQQVQGQNLNNALNKNSTSNAMLGRGLGNSSIAISGLAENDAKNTRLVGDINTARTGALNQVDEAKMLAQRNMNATLGELGASRQDAIQTLANQLDSEAWNKNYQTQQLELSRQNAQASQAYQNAQLAFEKQKYASTLQQTKDSNKIKDADISANLQYIINDPNATDEKKKQALATMYAQYKDNEDLQETTKQNIAKYFNQYNGHNPSSGMLNNQTSPSYGFQLPGTVLNPSFGTQMPTSYGVQMPTGYGVPSINKLKYGK